MTSHKASLTDKKSEPVLPTVLTSQKGRPKLVGYARVSSDDQTTALQRDALTAAGCEVIFEDSASGVRTDRVHFEEALAALKPGDTLVVWKLDRLGRSLAHLVTVADALRARDVYFRSLTEAIDTSTASGRLLYSVLGAVAQFERDVIVERTRAGMTAAKKRGVHVGRRHALRPSQIEEAEKMLEREDEPKSVSEVARVFGVGRATLYRAITDARAKRDEAFREMAATDNDPDSPQAQAAWLKYSAANDNVNDKIAIANKAVKKRETTKPGH